MPKKINIERPRCPNPNCASGNVKSNGKGRNNSRKWLCKDCMGSFTTYPEGADPGKPGRPISGKYGDGDRAGTDAERTQASREKTGSTGNETRDRRTKNISKTP